MNTLCRPAWVMALTCRLVDRCLLGCLLIKMSSDVCISEVPSPPINLRVTDTGSGTISTAWDAPKSDGGSPITGYKIEICRSGSSVWTKAAEVGGSDLSCEVVGLIDGEYYFVRIHAENEAGISPRALEMSQPVCARRPTRKLSGLQF